MPESYPSGPCLRRPFLITPYTSDSDGRLRPAIPACCPNGSAAKTSDCTISIDHYRDRKTGPKHPLAVAHCCAHGSAYTLYPPGFAPYRRQAVIKIAPDGNALSTEEAGLRKDFSDTVFAAALDSADGIPWARNSDLSLPEFFWGTQGRHLKFATRLFGIAHDLGDRARELVARSLSASGLAQREHSSAKGYRALGKAICSILTGLRGNHESLAFALLVCGYLVGHWGEPLCWDVARQDMLRSPLCEIRITPD